MKRATLLLTTLSLFLTSGCAPRQKVDVRAQEGRPESAQVKQVSIPYQAGKPTYVLIVEPFQGTNQVITWTHDETASVGISDKLAAQLTTALSKVGNFQLVDSAHRNKLKIGKGEKGPYIVRATLTEFNEVADAQAENNGVGLGGVGAVLGIAGAIADKPGLMWSGAGLAAANPTYEDSTAARTGMVAFDVSIVDDKTGRIITSFDSSGQFKAASSVSGFSLFGIGSEKAEFQSSALGQALRMALNDTVQQAHSALMGR